MCGTHRENALGKGFSRPLHYAQHLLCDHQKKDNLMSKMNELEFWGKPSEVTLKEKCEKDIGSERVPALTDIESHTQLGPVWK